MKNSEFGDYFQILTYYDYEQTNGIQLELFYTSPTGNTTASQRIKYHTFFFEKTHNFEIKS